MRRCRPHRRIREPKERAMSSEQFCRALLRTERGPRFEEVEVRSRSSCNESNGLGTASDLTRPVSFELITPFRASVSIMWLLHKSQISVTFRYQLAGEGQISDAENRYPSQRQQPDSNQDHSILTSCARILRRSFAYRS